MCLAIPGRILAITSQPPAAVSADTADRHQDDPLWRMAQVDFGGVRQQVSLACLPQARVGDRVLVHVGLALSLVEDGDAPMDEAEHVAG
jgi:hydrogenase expression/formation protein HypC